MIAMRRADVADLNARARNKMRDAGRLGPDIDYDGKAFASGDEIVVARNDRQLGVLKGDRGRVVDAAESHLEIKLDRGDDLRLPRTFVADHHIDHSYATTAHKAQWATVDQAFVLGSQEAYREWGYTALSRHRDQSTYYLTEPKDFINRDDPHKLDDPEQLALNLEQSLAESRRRELAIELAERYGTRQPTPPPDRDLDMGMDFGM
jgi:ATP-dependent exoDNAse (exonuclease V) alpha subunit